VGIFSDIAGGAGSVLETVGAGAASFGQGVFTGSSSQIRIPPQRRGEEDSTYLSRVHAFMREQRQGKASGRRSGISELLDFGHALEMSKATPWREEGLVDKFDALDATQQLQIARSGSLDSLTGDTYFERGGILNPTLPRPARDVIKGIPLVGEEVERIATGTTTPIGLLGAGVFGPGVAARGVAGSLAGGLGGQALESAGVDPRIDVGPLTVSAALVGGLAGRRAGVGGLRSAAVAGTAGLAAEQVTDTPALELGPRSIGEIAGGLWTGTPHLSPSAKAAAVTARTKNLGELRNLIEVSEESMRKTGAITVDQEAALTRMKMYVDNGPLEQHNYAAQFQGGNVSPSLMEQDFATVFAAAVGEPGGGGAFGNQAAGKANVGWLSDHTRWITNRASRQWMLKESSPDWYALNAHMSMEGAADGWGNGLQGMALAEAEAGFGMRMLQGEGLTGVAERVTGRAGIKARQVVAPLSDQFLDMPKGKGGLEPTVQNIIENPGAWDLTYAQTNVIEGYHAFIQGVDDHVRASLKALGRTPKEIDAYLKKIPGQEGPYFHRLAVDGEGNVMGATNKNWGAEQNFQKQRSDLATTRYLDSMTASASNYAENAMRVLTYETILKPMAHRLGVKASEFVPQGFISDLDAKKAQGAWLKKAEHLASTANSGRNPQTIRKLAAELAQDPNAPPGLADELYPLSQVEDDIIAGAAENVGQKVKAAAKATAKSIAADEKLLVTQQKAFGNLRKAWLAQNADAVKQGDIASRQTQGALDRINNAVEDVIASMAASRKALGKTAEKAAVALAKPKGTERVAIERLVKMMDEVADVSLPAGVRDAINDIVAAEGRIVEFGKRSQLATKGGETVAKGKAASTAAETRAAGEANRALGASDEAVAATQTVARGEEARKLYRANARAVLKKIKSATGDNAVGRQLATNQIQMAKRFIAGTKGYKMLDANKFSGLSGYRFQDDLAKEINKAFSNYEPSQGLINDINGYMAFQHMLVAGTADMGQLGLHLFVMLRPGTIRMVPRMLKDMLTDQATDAFIAGAASRRSMDGTSMRTHATRYNLRHAVEAARASDVQFMPGVNLKTATGYVQNWWVNATFSRGIRWGRQSQFEHNIRLIEASTGKPITPAEGQIAARNAEMITGDFNWTRAGIPQTQRTAERTALRFAPTWVRSQMKLIISAATLSRGAEAMLARKALAAEITTMAMIYTGAAFATGQSAPEVASNLSPLKADGTYNKNFMTISVKDPITGKGVKMGPGGVVLSVMRTASKMADLSFKAAQGDKEALNRLVDIRDTGQPLTGFWRAGAPILTGLMYDIVQGRESYGDRELGAEPEHWMNNAKSFVEGFEPFSISALREEGPLSGVTQSLGGRAFPVSAPELFLDEGDRLAQEEGFQSWKDTPKATRAALIRGNEKLSDLDAEREKFYERFGNDEDKLFDEIDKSQGAMEEGLLASYAGVQAGVLSIPDFRQRFSEMQREHGHLANSLLGASDDDVAVMRKDETKQDFYARQYTAIQPEQFDQDQDGVVDEVEFQEWRKARAAFWQENPEASNFRSYITVDYQARKWKTPEMGAIALERYEALDLYEEFGRMPKYQGLSVDDADFVDRARKVKERIVDEARYQGGQLSSRQAWSAVMQQVGNMTQRQASLFQMAMALDDRTVRSRLFNPARVSFLQANPLLAEWYPSVIEGAGISTGDRGRLGLPPPAGDSAEAQVAQLAR